ncbi:MAG: PKD domain-containing protein [Bacteroidia bacterium]|nr:PKD domain-containing protein [Bacteroidia bacterium]
MKHFLLFAGVFLGCVANALSEKLSAPASSRLFIENLGQITERDGKARPDIYFMLRDAGMNLFVTSMGLHYQFSKIGKALALPVKDTAEVPYNISLYRMEMELVGANPRAEIVKQEQQEYYENYYNIIGMPEGIPFVHTYTRIIYKNIYPQIDWVLYVKNNEVKYDFLVHPGGDAGQIKLRYKGADDAHVNADGSVTFITPLGQVNEMPPVSWVDETKQPVTSRYLLIKKDNDYLMSFDLSNLPPPANSTYSLTIDPVLLWSSYYGGGSIDYFKGTTRDADGNIIFVGVASSGSLATSGAYSTSITGYYDGLLAKFTPGQSRMWATYYGGVQRDEFYCVAADRSSNIYAAGITKSSTNIATSQAHKTTFNSGISYVEGLIVAFTSAGNRIWGTYFGGEDDDHICGIAVNREDQLFIAGQTLSTDGIASAIPGYFVQMSGATPITSSVYNGPAFIASFNKSGKKLWGTYYGENFSFTSYNLTTIKPVDITCDNAGYVYFTGYSFPSSAQTRALYIQNAFQNTYAGGIEGCLAKFKPNGQRVWGTFVGGSGDDYVHGITCDDSANVYICGATGSAGMAYNGWQSTFSGQNAAFVAKYDSSGKRIWYTYLGGPSTSVNELNLYAAQADEKGNVLVGGISSNNFGYAPFTSYGGGMDFFLARFTANGTLKWCTPKGGADSDDLRDITVDNEGAVYAAGFTPSTSGIAYNAFQSSYGGGTNSWDGVMMKIQYDTLKLIRPQLDKIEYCKGDSAWVKFKVNAAFNANDTFRIELSNNNGVFVNTTLLGVKPYTSVGLDSIKIALPSGLTQNGYYRARVVATSPADTSFASAFFIIQVPASAVITPSAKTDICQGAAISLSVPVYPVTYRWQKNGANTSSAGDTLNSLLVNQAGTYRVKLTTSAGCVSYSNDTIVTVNPYPVINAKINTTGQCLTNNLFKVADSSTISAGVIANRLWNLGDNITATALDTQRHFTNPGNYTITLVVTSGVGCSKSTGIPVTVYPQPVARLYQTSTANQCFTNNSFTFIDSSSIDSGYAINSVQLLMGNGNVFNSGSKIYSYPQPGSYTIYLRTTSNKGCLDSALTQVNVFPQPATGFSINDSAQCKTGNSFVFTNTSTIAAGSIDSNTWYSSDGFIFTTSNFTRSYLNAMSYSIKLITVSNQGCKDSLSKIIEVYSHPKAVFTINADSQCVLGNQYIFTNGSFISAGYSITQWNWRFGDSYTDSIKNVSHSYSGAGNYTVQLIATSNNGCNDTLQKSLVVKSSPAKPVITKNLFSLTSSNANTYQWLLNGANISGATAQNHTAIQNGYYQVRVTETNGCSNTSDSTFIGNVSTGQISSASNIVLYPNPTTGTFSLTWPGKEQVDVIIYNSKGEEIAIDYNISSGQTLTLPSGCAAGLYWIKIHNREINEVIKLVKW